MRLLLCCIVAAAGCSSKTVAPSDVCQKLVSAGAVSNCYHDTPINDFARAREKVGFELPEVTTNGGGVFAFDNADDYTATVKALEDEAQLAGLWRFGNKKARIFVYINKRAAPEVGAKARAVVEAL
jgi:hypothetical protein